VQQTSHKYVEPSNVPPGVAGRGGTEVWTFKALKAGTTTIATDYRMSTRPTPMCSFTAKITVQ
jgi:inhibitor of cysteine peptidase